MIKDLLGDRIKKYEAVYRHALTPNMPLFLRVDGRAFHTFTRKCEKPFDNDIIKAMVFATTKTAKEMSGFKLAYTQSDEATFMLTDYDTLETQGWFDYDLNKIVSLTASLFSGYFNSYYYKAGRTQLAAFDCRAFSVPEGDAANVFVWRQKDWLRNSVQMFARGSMSHKQCEGKKIPELLQILHDEGKDWENLPDNIKFGTFIDNVKDELCQKFSYYDIDKIIKNGSKEHNI
jgi:tRNA(His) 5'-end guanylyltransferase